MQDADKKGLSAISEDVKNLAKKARENSLKPAEYEVWTVPIFLLNLFGLSSNMIQYLIINTLFFCRVVRSLFQI